MALDTDVVGKSSSENMAEEDPLKHLLRDPHVHRQVDWDFANGLPYARRVDYFIGKGVQAVVDLTGKDDAAASVIADVLRQLRGNPRYEHYFCSKSTVLIPAEDTVKNPRYKAIGSWSL